MIGVIAAIFFTILLVPFLNSDSRPFHSAYQGGWDCGLTPKNCVPYDSSVGGAIFRITPAKDAID
jgi:hypothetical protein